MLLDKPPKDLLTYKSACVDLKQKFQSYLWQLEAQISSEPWDEKFSKEIDRLVKTEIIPEAQRIRERKIEIWEKLFGQALKSAVPISSALLGITLVAGLSFGEILLYSTGIMGAANLKPLIDAWQEERKLRRNALFFLLRFRR